MKRLTKSQYEVIAQALNTQRYAIIGNDQTTLNMVIENLIYNFSAHDKEFNVNRFRQLAGHPLADWSDKFPSEVKIS